MKSAVDGGSFEYQYHRNSWQQNSPTTAAPGTFFIWHKNELAHVEVWFCGGTRLNEIFDAWEAEKPYSKGGQQRFRKNISAGWVKNNATLLLRIENGEAT